MQYKDFGEFSSIVRKANAFRLRRLVGFTLSNCRIPFYKFCERAGMNYNSVRRILDGKYSPSCDRIMWLEYICEVFNTESDSNELLPRGIADEIAGI